MKTIITLFITFLSYTAYSQVVISDQNEDVQNVEESAILELRSNTKGLLIPRLANSSVFNGTPEAGTVFYNLEKGCIQGWNGTNFIELTTCTQPNFESLFSENFQAFRGSGFKSL